MVNLLAKNRKQRQAEREEEREARRARRENILKGAAAAGVAVVGFANRGRIGDFLADNKVRLARTFDSKTYKKLSGQLSDFAGAVTDVYGEDPKLRHTLTRIGTPLHSDEMFETRLRARQKQRTLNTQTFLPKDLRKEADLIAGPNKNWQTARREARKDFMVETLDNIETFRGGRYKDIFAGSTEAIKQLYFDHPELMEIRKADFEDAKGIRDYHKGLIDALLSPEEGGKKAYQLKIDPANKEQFDTFYEGMLQFSDDIRVHTAKQADEAREYLQNGIIKQLKPPVDNRLFNYYQYFEASQFHTLRQEKDPTGWMRKNKALWDRGFRPSTIDDAVNQAVVERNGRLFLTKPSSKTNDPFLGDYFGYQAHEVLTTDNQANRIISTKTNLAQRYLRKGENYGLSDEDLGKDLFSDQILINVKTQEVLNLGPMQKAIDDAADFGQNHFKVPFMNFNAFDLLHYNSYKASKEAPNWLVHSSQESILTFLDQTKLSTRPAAEARNQGARANPTAQAYVFANGDILSTHNVDDLSGLDPQSAYAAFVGNYDQNILATGMREVNTHNGLYKKYGEALSGRTNIESDGREHPFKKLFAIGQENETVWSRLSRSISKFEDPYYAENLPNTMLNGLGGGRHTPEAQKAVDRIYADLYGRTKDLSTETENMVYGQLNAVLNRNLGLNEDIDLFRMTDDEGILDIAAKIAYNRDRRGGRLADDNSPYAQRFLENTEAEIANMFYNRYGKGQEGFLNAKRYLKNRDIIKPEFLNMFEDYEERTVSATADMKRLIEQYALLSSEAAGKPVTELVQTAMMAGTFTKAGQEELYQLRSLSQMSYFNQKQQSASAIEAAGAMDEIYDFFVEENPRELANLQVSLKKADPWYGTGAGQEMEDLLGSQIYSPIQHKTTALEAFNAAYTAAADSPSGANPAVQQAMAVASGLTNSAKAFFEEAFASPTHGRITDRTANAWFWGNRLDAPLQDIGLGLPNDKKGSFQSILFNQWGRRIVLPYMAFQQLHNLDDMTGDTASDTAADTYVNMHQDVNWVKEATGLNHMGRSLEQIFPYMEQVKEWTPVKAFNAATLGAFSDFRSPEDLKSYYESGEDPIRKGRYWPIGSSSPWWGDKVDHYEPNWYRKLKSDYAYSDNMYGSEREYWANNWMPTLSHPFAPIKHFLTDPYHYEKKHAEDRPWAVTGGFAELDNIPVVGPVVDKAVSSILKPQRTNRRLRGAHEQYLTDYNERLAAAYLNMNAGGTLNVGPTGATVLKSDTYDVNLTGLKDENGEYDEEALVGDAMQFNGERQRMAASLLNDTGVLPQFEYTLGDRLRAAFASFRDGDGVLGGNVPLISLPNLTPGQRIGSAITSAQAGNGFFGGDIPLFGAPQPNGYGSNVSQAMLKIINQNLTDAKTTNRSDYVSQAGTLGDPFAVQNLGDVTNQNALFSKDGVSRDVFYNLGEFAGIYGFGSKTLLGWDESGRGQTLESSDLFSNYNRDFWDMNLGGLGGDLSEIGRRYIPRDPNRHYYNPIRNEMPLWMPGPGYFTDYLHGDPYSKVANGEIRLPGEAYEKLYGVKKDANGNYSAMDRFRILADVAPYSDQYRAAKKEMALLNGNGLLSEAEQEDYRNIREQVRTKTKKKTFYEERFQNADVVYENVTVTRVIDNNRFLTKEYGENPLKLAGVTVTTEDTENSELIGQFIHKGARLKVALDADPNRRVRDDMMDTMRAVVYTPHAGKGTLGGLHGIGSGANLNYYLSKHDEAHGGKVTVHDDGSATSTVALFSKEALTVGGLVERVTHDILPQVPILGVVFDKFLQVRSPVEAYRRELYGKSWRDWKHPIDGWLRPMMETITDRNPLIAFAEGYGIGRLFSKQHKGYVGLSLGLISGVAAGMNTLREAADEVTPGRDRLVIPERRQKERDIDEYFDKLKYVKYKGLYERTKDLAEKEEGVDLDRFFALEQKKGKNHKRLKRALENRKKWLTINKKSGAGWEWKQKIELAEVEAQLAQLDGDRSSGPVDSYTALALRYKDEFESTLYGAAQTQNFNNVYRALPTKDKQYFTAFAKASPREREEILQLVPENQRAIYQQQFGMKVDRQQSLDDYFKTHNLPGKDWSGWDPREALDNIKIKVMKNEGIELTEANYWEDDERIAEASNAEAVAVNKARLSSGINKARLEEILRGAGLKNVQITLSTSAADSDQIQTDFQIERDRTKEIETGLHQQIMQG